MFIGIILCQHFNSYIKNYVSKHKDSYIQHISITTSVDTFSSSVVTMYSYELIKTNIQKVPVHNLIGLYK